MSPPKRMWQCSRCKQLIPRELFPPRKKVCSSCLSKPMRKCCRCTRLKPIKDFTYCTGLSTADNRLSYCKKCAADARQLYLTPHRRHAEITKQYGITPEEYMKIAESQNHQCWICGRLPKTRRLNIDHDHKIGKVKEAIVGLVCGACNQAMGGFRDSPYLLHRAAQFKLIRPAQKVLTTADS